ncbi:MAG: hypothetical protein M3520_04075 [Actinomycetota bacterium]|nr:hypothetical protein [Actinomycetota bacterium]
MSRAMAVAAVDQARRCVASALEAYPIDPDGPISEELHVGPRSAIADAGLIDVHQPSKRARVMRIDVPEPQGADR